MNEWKKVYLSGMYGWKKGKDLLTLWHLSNRWVVFVNDIELKGFSTEDFARKYIKQYMTKH